MIMSSTNLIKKVLKGMTDPISITLQAQRPILLFSLHTMGMLRLLGTAQ
jgi:hypothetical protein